MLSYLDIGIFQAVVTAFEISTKNFAEIKTFLCERYSSTDVYLERIDFFETKYTAPAEKYAASLNGYMDKFSQDVGSFREQVLISKFIASTKHTPLSGELRLRRPTTLNDCVKIANSIDITDGWSSSCMAVKN